MSEEQAIPATREQLEQELIVVRCQLGERAAFEALVARWHLPLWRYIRGTVGDETLAEEILQDAWLRILCGIPRLRDPAKLKSWLFAITRRACIDRIRSRYSQADCEPLEEEPEDGSTPDVLAWENNARLQVALGHLSPIDRETTVLFYLQELDLHEVATLLGVPIGTVKSRLHRARGLLRAELTLSNAGESK